jgi:hypothetical protein
MYAESQNEVLSVSVQSGASHLPTANSRVVEEPTFPYPFDNIENTDFDISQDNITVNDGHM